MFLPEVVVWRGAYHSNEHGGTKTVERFVAAVEKRPLCFVFPFVGSERLFIHRLPPLSLQMIACDNQDCPYQWVSASTTSSFFDADAAQLLCDRYSLPFPVPITIPLPLPSFACFFVSFHFILRLGRFYS